MARASCSRARPRRRTWPALLITALLSATIPTADAFYLPGVTPRSYAANDVVNFTVNSLMPVAVATADSSMQPQLKSLINIDYYTENLRFCQPPGGPVAQAENLGSALFGDRIYNSPMSARMLQNQTCVKICESQYNNVDGHLIARIIQENYAVRWAVDGLPVATLQIEQETHEQFYSIGFPLGRRVDRHGLELNPPALNNHFDVFIDYHQRGPDEYRVVGAKVFPDSRQTISVPGSAPNCKATSKVQLPSDMSGKATSLTNVAFTMSVHWVESSTPWATRWDHYLRVFDPRIHWFSIINAVVIVSFLCVMVAMILVRSISRDIGRYNAIDLDEDVQEDFGWKLVHGEVFRPPHHPMLLSIMAGSGSQLVCMALVTLAFALFGFLSPSSRGSLATVMIVSWTLFGVVSGYMSARVYASLDGERWKMNMFGASVLFPTVIFAIVNLLNFFLVFSGSSGAVPFGTFFALIALWFLINVPLSLLGSTVGIKAGSWRHPVRVSPIPRQIPPTIWYLRPVPSALLAGILPFGAAFLELFFLLNSLFGAKVYYAFGFLALTFTITALTTATVTILWCYFTLCAEDYRWHWRAFVTGGGSAFWLFTYGLFYWATRLELAGLTNKVLYLGYLTLLSLVDFLLFGSIGYLACYFALRRIYSQVRID